MTFIEKSLPLDSLSLWKQRGNIDHIVLLDWNSTLEQVQIGQPLQTLKDALFKVSVLSSKYANTYKLPWKQYHIIIISHKAYQSSDGSASKAKCYDLEILP